MPEPLSLFHPLIQAWVRAQVGTPTDIQDQAWPRIAAGKHVLLTAPTGSGKTLTAFLWALDRFATGAWPPGATRILYVSPLKALNADIQRNLLGPLQGIRSRFQAQAAIAFPDIRVQVRSGDTPAGERRRMLRHPPEILITTPESLNLMLLTQAGRDSFSGLEVVILDEIHAVAGSKRGVHLITAVERLVPLTTKATTAGTAKPGGFQRIALSATVNPPETVAAWVGGYTLGAAGYAPRPVEWVESRAKKEYQLHVRYPVDSHPDRQDIWSKIAAGVLGLIAQGRSTLVFANNRRLSERLARLLNGNAAEPTRKPAFCDGESFCENCKNRSAISKSARFFEAFAARYIELPRANVNCATTAESATDLMPACSTTSALSFWSTSMKACASCR